MIHAFDYILKDRAFSKLLTCIFSGWDLSFKNNIEKVTYSFGCGLVFGSNLFDVKLNFMVYFLDYFQLNLP